MLQICVYLVLLGDFCEITLLTIVYMFTFIIWIISILDVKIAIRIETGHVRESERERESGREDFGESGRLETSWHEFICLGRVSVRKLREQS